MPNQNQLALVTGASSGIGEALCILLAEKKFDLIITGRNKEQLQALADKLQTKVKVIIVAADLVISEERKKIIEWIHQLTPDLVINNAGFGLYGYSTELSTQKQLEMVQLNVEALLEISLESARALKREAKEGVIMNIASVAAFPVFPGFAVYAATKAFVLSFSQSQDEELKAEGIRVLVCCPGRVKTHFQERASSSSSSQNSRAQMTAQYAVEQIWYQIERKKPVHIFNWKYRFATFLIQYIFPKRLVARFLRRIILLRSE